MLRVFEIKTMNPISVRPWFLNLHVGLFSIPLGLFALSGAWGKLAFIQSSITVLLSLILRDVATTTLIVMLILYFLKIILHPKDLINEYYHPVLSAMMALIPVCCMLAVVLLLPVHPDYLFLAQVVVALSLIAQGLISWRVVKLLSTGSMPSELVSPALYLPIVPGGFVGAMALKLIGLPGFAMLLFGMGLGGWALLEIRILHRLFAGPLPLALRSTLGMEIAPAAVGTLAVVNLWPELSADVIVICLGVASGPVFAVLTRWRWWVKAPFNFGFWSFSFPLAAMAASICEAVRRGAWPSYVAILFVILVSLVVGFLMVRTIIKAFK